MTTKLPPYRYSTSNIPRDLFEMVQDALQAGESVRSIRSRFRKEGFRYSNQAISDIRKELTQMAQQNVKHLRNDYRPIPIRSGRFFSNMFRYYGVAYLWGIDIEDRYWSHDAWHGFQEARGELNNEGACTLELPLMFQDGELLTGRLIRERLESLAENSVDSMNLHSEKYEFDQYGIERVVITNVLQSR